jgi:hypothetical protein
MADNVFDTILAKGARAGQMPARTQQARDWYRRAGQEFSGIRSNTLMKRNPSKLSQKLMIGQMFLFNYDAKHKKTLPYFDRFPLIFPFMSHGNGFTGINLHYLPLNLRAKLMDGLYDITNNNKFDESTKLNISYDLLKSAAKFKFFRPTVHRYLLNHVKSRFMMVDSAEWDLILFMPLQKFSGASARQVWTESRKKISK